MKTPGILLLVGGVIVLIYGLLLAAMGAVIGASLGMLAGAGGLGAALGSLIGGIFVIFGILIMAAAFWYEKKPGWAWVGLIFSLLTLLMPFGGFFIGPFLAAIGAAMAMGSRKGK